MGYQRFLLAQLHFQSVLDKLRELRFYPFAVLLAPVDGNQKIVRIANIFKLLVVTQLRGYF